MDRKKWKRVFINKLDMGYLSSCVQNIKYSLNLTWAASVDVAMNEFSFWCYNWKYIVWHTHLTYIYTHMKVFPWEQVEAVNIYCYNVFIHTCVREMAYAGTNTVTVFEEWIYYELYANYINIDINMNFEIHFRFRNWNIFKFNYLIVFE